MTKTTEAIPKSGLIASSDEHAPPLKPYKSPLLREWGSILELTGGPTAGFKDAGFHGSSGGV